MDDNVNTERDFRSASQQVLDKLKNTVNIVTTLLFLLFMNVCYIIYIRSLFTEQI